MCCFVLYYEHLCCSVQSFLKYNVITFILFWHAFIEVPRFDPPWRGLKLTYKFNWSKQWVLLILLKVRFWMQECYCFKHCDISTFVKGLNTSFKSHVKTNGTNALLLTVLQLDIYPTTSFHSVFPSDCRGIQRAAFTPLTSSFKQSSPNIKGIWYRQNNKTNRVGNCEKN